MMPSPEFLDRIAPHGAGWVYGAVFGIPVIYVLVRASRIRAWNPDHPFAQLAPEVLLPAALEAIRSRAANARALVATSIHRKRRLAGTAGRARGLRSS